MKKVIFLLSFLITIVGLMANAQVVQMQVQIYPQQVLANAPFKIFVSAYALSGEPISYISATFDGTSAKCTGSTASFEFIAPSIAQSAQNFPLVISARTQNGEVFDKQSTVTVSINANPVIEIGKPIPSKNSYIGNVPDVKIPVKVYGGLGLDKIEFMVDTNVASVIDVSPAATVYFSRTFTVDITHLKNGWHIFSVKAVNIAGEIFSSISGYVVNTIPPEVHFVDIKPYLPANSNVPINVTAVSTISGIATVTINGVEAKLLYNSTWGATILTPSKTGPFEIVAKAEDGAGNVSALPFKSFLDGMYPYMSITTNASMIRNGVSWGKYALPSFTFMATTACLQVIPEISVNVPTSKSIDEFQGHLNGYLTKTAKVNFDSPGTYDAKITATDPVNGLITAVSTVLNVDFYPYLPQILKVSYPKNVGPNSLFEVSVMATDFTGIGVEKVLINDRNTSKTNDELWYENLSSGRPAKSGYENFNVHVFDYLGNEISSAYSYFVDVNPPHVSITPIASLYVNGTYWNTNTPVSININATTDSKTLPHTTVMINGDPQIYTGKNFISIKLNAPNTYKITVVSTNEVNGLSTTASGTYKIAFDTTSPEIGQITYPATLAPNTPFSVKAEVYDKFGPGIDFVTFNGINAVKIDNTTWLATLTSAQTGGYESIMVKANDLLGLSSSVEKKYFVDSQPPTVGIIPVASLFMNNTYWNLSTPAFVEISSNTDSGILPETQVTINGEKTVIYKRQVEMPVNQTGIYNINVISTNTVNNLKTDISKSFKFAFDISNPQITSITYPATLGPNIAFPVKIITFDGTGIGIKEVSVNGLKTLKVNDSTWLATITSANSSQPGTVNFNVMAKDYLGKTVKTIKSYFVDTRPPVVEVYLNGKKIENGSEFYTFEKATPTILVKGTTCGMVKPDFVITLNNQKINEQSFDISGINELSVLAVNPVNDKTTKFNAKFAISVDPHAPQLTLSAPATVNMRSDANFTMEIQGNDLRFGTLSADVDEMPLYFNTFSSTGKYTLTLRRALAKIDGEYVTITLKAVDMAGNVSEQKDLIYVDTVGPDIKDVKFSKGNLTVYFDKQVEGKANISVETLNGGIFNLGAGMIDGNTITVKNVQIPYGPYKVIVDGITDSAGNILMNNGSIWEF